MTIHHTLFFMQTLRRYQVGNLYRTPEPLFEEKDPFSNSNGLGRSYFAKRKRKLGLLTEIRAPVSAKK